MAVKNSAGAEQVWTLELKNKGEVVTGKTDAKPDIVISLGDDVFCDLASGKLNGQKAFMSGKITVDGGGVGDGIWNMEMGEGDHTRGSVV